MSNIVKERSINISSIIRCLVVVNKVEVLLIVTVVLVVALDVAVAVLVKQM